MSASEYATLQRQLRQTGVKILNETALPMDVWIDGSHMVRKMRYDRKIEVKGLTQPVAASYTLVVDHYGPEPEPTPPPAGETSNLLQLARQDGRTSALSQALGQAG